MIILGGFQTALKTYKTFPKLQSQIALADCGVRMHRILISLLGKYILFTRYQAATERMNHWTGQRLGTELLKDIV